MKIKAKHSNFILPVIIFFAAGAFTHCTAQKQDSIKNVKSNLAHGYGKASYYANMLQGSNTSSGDAYDKNDFTCAHRKLPFNTILSVVNTNNGKKAIVRVNDRGPYRKGRMLDLSRAAAKKLGMVPDGVVKVQIEELTLTDSFPMKDSLLHNADIIDAQGNLNQPENYFIKVWNTQNFEHAIYMAREIESDYAVCIYIKVADTPDDRNFTLFVPAIKNKEDADKLIATLKQDGFSFCRYVKK